MAVEVASDQRYAADAAFWQLTISAGRYTAEATIAWATQSLAALDTM